MVGATRTLARQFDIVGALTMREVHIRYGRKNIGFLWIMVEPFLFTFGVIALRSLLPVATESRGVPLVGFLMTGYTPFLL
jgi:capsular polysaccharide transport system permease protein